VRGAESTDLIDSELAEVECWQRLTPATSTGSYVFAFDRAILRDAPPGCIYGGATSRPRPL